MVEAVSGQKLDRYLQDHIFGPLGMKDTSFKLSASQRERLAAVHQRARRRHAGPDRVRDPAGAGVPHGRRRPLRHRPRLHGLLPHDPERRHAQRRAGAAAETRWTSWPRTTSAPSRSACSRPRSRRSSERRRALPGHEQEVGAELPDQYPGRCRAAARPAAWPGPGSPTPTSGSTAPSACAASSLSQLLPFYDDTAIDLLGKFETSVYQNV